MDYEPESDLYAVLGVRPDATPDAVRKGHRDRIKRAHPDKETGDHAAAVALNHACDVLLDPASRAAYDRARAAYWAAQSASARAWRPDREASRQAPPPGAATGATVRIFSTLAEERIADMAPLQRRYAPVLSVLGALADAAVEAFMKEAARRYAGAAGRRRQGAPTSGRRRGPRRRNRGNGCQSEG